MYRFPILICAISAGILLSTSTFAKDKFPAKSCGEYLSQHKTQLADEIEAYHHEMAKTAFQWFFEVAAGRDEERLQYLMEDPEQRVDIRAYQEAFEPQMRRWTDLHYAFEREETDAGYPSVEQYVRFLTDLRRKLGTQLPENAYYPFAGVDFAVASIFQNTVFEDAHYGDSDWGKNMYWSPDYYSTEHLEAVVEALRKYGFIRDDHRFQLLKGQANQTRAENDFNRSDRTLVIKGGHSVLPVLEERFGSTGLQFGAILLGSPADDIAELNSYLNDQGYVLVFEDSDHAEIRTPFALKLGSVFVFVKSKRTSK